MNEYDYKLYDEIVNATFINISNMSKDGKIIFLNFNKYSLKDLYLFKVATQVTSVMIDTSRTIYVDLNLFSYLLFKLKYRKFKIRRLTKNIITEKSTPILSSNLLSFMAKEFEEDINVFDNIYNEYYNIK